MSSNRTENSNFDFTIKLQTNNDLLNKNVDIKCNADDAFLE